MANLGPAFTRKMQTHQGEWHKDAKIVISRAAMKSPTRQCANQQSAVQGSRSANQEEHFKLSAPFQLMTFSKDSNFSQQKCNTAQCSVSTLPGWPTCQHEDTGVKPLFLSGAMQSSIHPVSFLGSHLSSDQNPATEPFAVDSRSYHSQDASRPTKCSVSIDQDSRASGQRDHQPENKAAFRRQKMHSKARRVPFPKTLYRLLEETLENGEDEIISFTDSGQAFCIHDPVVFSRKICPRYFRHSQVHSFQRQLNKYGFVRITTGPERGAYYHPLLQRGLPHLCVGIRRVYESKTNVQHFPSNPS